MHAGAGGCDTAFALCFRCLRGLEHRLCLAALQVFTVLFIWQPAKHKWVEYGRTETVSHGTSPTFTQCAAAAAAAGH